MNMNRLIIIFILTIVIVKADAQVTYQYGLLPSVTLRKNFPTNWTAVFKVDSRQSIFREEFNYDYLLTDISMVALRRITSNLTFGGGYLLRVDGVDLYHRSIQQITLTRRFPTFRMAHRLMTDQTFGLHAPAEYRLRYRISADLPLEGHTIDINEFYLKVNNEYLNSWEDGEYDLEIRNVALLGYTLTSKSDLEVGIDYRIDRFIGGGLRNRFWLSVNFIHIL